MASYSLTKNPTDVLLAVALIHKKLRKKNGLSQQELASRSGVSLGSIKRFETSGQISFESLLKLAHILNRLDDFDALFKPNDSNENIEKLFSSKTRL